MTKPKSISQRKTEQMDKRIHNRVRLAVNTFPIPLPQAYAIATVAEKLNRAPDGWTLAAPHFVFDEHKIQVIYAVRGHRLQTPDAPDETAVTGYILVWISHLTKGYAYDPRGWIEKTALTYSAGTQLWEVESSLLRPLAELAQKDNDE